VPSGTGAVNGHKKIRKDVASDVVVWQAAAPSPAHEMESGFGDGALVAFVPKDRPLYNRGETLENS
jgi:hypothetical protein